MLSRAWTRTSLISACPTTPPVLPPTHHPSEQVSRRLNAIPPTPQPRSAPVELYAGVYADALVRDTATVTLDLGLDVHLAMPRGEAAVYAARRAQVLAGKRAALAVREERLKWEVEQFQGALGLGGGGAEDGEAGEGAMDVDAGN